MLEQNNQDKENKEETICILNDPVFLIKMIVSSLSSIFVLVTYKTVFLEESFLITFTSYIRYCLSRLQIQQFSM